MQHSDTWESSLPSGVLGVLYQLGKEFQFDPNFPQEMEIYFVELIQEAQMSNQNVALWLRERVTEDFICLGVPPKWRQNPEWQISDGKPMLFVGQIDVPQSASAFHDDSSFYVFLEKEGRGTKVVIQVS